MTRSIIGAASAHESAGLHVRGAATYVDDIREPDGTLHLAPGTAECAHGLIRAVDLSRVREAPGVVTVLTAADIPEDNNCSPSMHDDAILAENEIVFHGQVVFVVVARSREQARHAARLGRIDVSSQSPLIEVEDGLAAGAEVLQPYRFERGDVSAAIDRSRYGTKGSLRIGGQEHFYLEGQVSLAIPGEDDTMLVHCSTQHPTEVQHLIARMLGVPHAAVVCECRRMGGAFGGKESQAAQWACLAALASLVTGCPAKLRLDRDDDMIMTGKRHDARVDYRFGARLCEKSGSARLWMSMQRSC